MPSATRHAGPSSPRAASARQQVCFEISTKTLWFIGIVIAGVWLTFHLVPIILVIAGALMLVGALNPLIEGLERRKVRRGYAIAQVFTIGLVLFGFGLFFTVPPLLAQMRSVAEREPEIRSHIVTFLDAMPLTQALADELRNLHYGDLLKSSHTALINASMRAIEIVAYVLAAVFLALYVMIDRDRLRGALFALVPRRHHVRASRILLNLEVIVGGYIRGQVITCVVIGIFIFALLTICRVPNALALAVFGAVADVLPYVGPLLTIAPAVASAYVVGPWVAMTVLLALLLYEEAESRFLIPWVYGRALRLPSSAVFLALLIGGALGGIIGALLALPVASAIIMLIQELRVELPGEPAKAAAEEKRKDQREERVYKRRAVDAPSDKAAAIAVEIARERKEAESAAGK